MAGASKFHLSKQKAALLLRLSLALLYLVITGTVSLVTFATVRQQVAGSELLPDFIVKEHTQSGSSNTTQAKGESLPVWTGTKRVTFLFLGIDERAQKDDFWRTDTMIIATLDPVTMQVGVLSIPRDLWVTIPGFTEGRINTANALGDAYDYPGGGPALAMKTVEYNLGTPIDYYVRVNFQGFVDLVDLIGGIDIDVPEEIDDPYYPDYKYGYDPLHIDPGPHHFDGEEALKYARTRHTSGGDFDRARRQQQVIGAILQRISERQMLPKLAAQAPQILKSVGDSVQIDPQLKLDEIIALANLVVQNVKPEDIHYQVIDESCTLPKTTPDGQMILVPLRDRIRQVRDRAFGLRGDKSQQTVVEEAATVSVLNGTTTTGLAYSTSDYLKANGLDVEAYSNADRQDYDTSLIILNRDEPATAARLLELLKLPNSAIVNGSNPTAPYDVVVILGADYQP